MTHMSLADYYRIIFAMAQHHKYSIAEIENLVPYERDVYFAMLVNFIKEMEEKTKQKG